MRLALVFVVTLCFAAAAPPDSLARPLKTKSGFSEQLIRKDLSFHRSVSADLRRSFRSMSSAAPSPLAAMLDTVDGLVFVRMGSKKLMQGSAGLTTWRPGARRPYRIYLSREVKWSDFQGRVLAAHELGHVIDAAGVSGRAMRRVFLAKIKRSSKWRKCFPEPSRPSGCLPLAEIFADHVSFFAVPEKFTSGYGTPRMLSDRRMRSVLRRVWYPRVTPGDVGGK